MIEGKDNTLAYSVLMSVYNKEKPEYLYESMESMWRQTKATNDFVLVCDGPLTDELEEVITDMQKKHVNDLHVIRLKTNNGLGNALNIGLQYCKNELVARMDSDDISRYDRCQKLLEIFQKRPEVSLCSSTVIEIEGSVENVIGKRELPVTNDEIKVFSKKRNPFNHPAVMFKKAAVEAAGGYNEEYTMLEDYYLWIRMLRNGEKAMNIKDPLLYMRISDEFYMRRGGIQYAKKLLAFHGWMLCSGWLSLFTFITSAIPHAILCVMPNNIRKKVYKAIHS